MPFRYRLQKILEIRIRKKDEQLQAVIKAQEEVDRIELLIIKNLDEIKNLTEQMRSADPMTYETYDNFIKHLWEEDKKLKAEKVVALENLNKEKELLKVKEQEVNVLEKHKENKKEEKARELKELSEIGSQKFFMKQRDLKEDEELEELEELKNRKNGY